MSFLESLKFEPACLLDLDVIDHLEQTSYHPDEAATREKLKNRIEYAAHSGPELFLVAKDKETIVGFVCTTLSRSDLLTEESMDVHDPEGKTVCLHSVCVAPEYRKRGVATHLLNTWIGILRHHNELQTPKKYERVAILSRPNLLSLYGSVGFKNLGKSEVVHGPEPWYDCILEL
ncbi:acyl-CoA N-acyltransferase [Phycomyces blakesleeanus]